MDLVDLWPSTCRLACICSEPPARVPRSTVPMDGCGGANQGMSDRALEGNMEGCVEDCCCAFWCSCCVSIQLLRHTGVPKGSYMLTSEVGCDLPPVYDHSEAA